MLKGQLEIAVNPHAVRNEFRRPTIACRHAHGKLSPLVVREEMKTVAHLPQVVDTRDAAGATFGLTESGQQQRGEDRDDRNDAQQFDERESSQSALVESLHAEWDQAPAMPRDFAGKDSRSERILRFVHAFGVSVAQSDVRVQSLSMGEKPGAYGNFRPGSTFTSPGGKST